MKNFMIRTLLTHSILCLLFNSALADIGLPPVDLRPGQFVEGNLVSVKYVPGDKKMNFYILGKKQAEIRAFIRVQGKDIELQKLSDTEAYSYPGIPENKMILKVEKEGSHEEFLIKKP